MRDGALPPALDRPTLTYGQIYSRTDEFADPFQPCLLETKEFLLLVERLYGTKLPRRTLQLFSSPGYRLIPLPIHKGGYKSYYLNPEHTVRLGLVLHLQKKHYFPVSAIRKVMENLPEEQYRFIFEDILTGEEILDSAFLVKDGYGIKDVLYRKVCRVLQSIEEPYWKAREKYGKVDEDVLEKAADKALIGEAKALADWIKAGHRRRIEMADVGIQSEQSRDVISWHHAIRKEKS